MQITLNNFKLYVGSVLDSPNPASLGKYFKNQFWMSGHRAAADGRVTSSTYYDAILAEFDRNESRRRTVATFQLVSPVDKAVSASGVDLNAYKHFLCEQRVEGADPLVTDAARRSDAA